MTDSIFDQKDERDYLAELTGPNGKYDRTKYASEVEMYKAIAKGKVLGDEFIDHKNKEFDELRQDYLKVREENVTKAKLEDYLGKLENVKTNEPAITQPKEVKPEIDEAKLRQFLREEFSTMESQKRESDNLASVEQTLRQRFGDNAPSILKEKMNALNLTNEDLKFLAKKSPDAVINALGLNQQQESFQSPPRSNVRSDSFKPNVEIRDAVYWEKLRRENPKEYFSEKSSILRLKDMEDENFLTRYNQRRNARTFT